MSMLEAPKIAWLPVWSPIKWSLVLANVLLAALLIVLANTGVVPLGSVNFLFFFFVTLLFALYRPGWTFLFLVGLLPLEIVNLAPEGWGMHLRPYQWASVILVLALAIRMFMGRLTFPLFTFRWFDAVLFLVPAGAFLSVWNAPDPGLALKQALIITSYFLLYLLCRQYLQTSDDIRQTLPFFFGTSAVVLGYALWQSAREQAGFEAFTAMAGRPNSTFTEADWLGMFVLFLLCVLWVLGLQKRELWETFGKFEMKKCIFAGPWPALFFALHTLAFLVLIVTVSRSAWLGTLLSALFFAVLLLTTPSLSEKKMSIQRALLFLTLFFSSLLAALGLASVFQLTSFPLFDRAASTATGFQKITVACEKSVSLPARIQNTQELTLLGCRHIRLEERENLAQAGFAIGEVSRPDPNIEERKNTYQTSLGVIREHSFFGIGWGNIGASLGTDERGARLNASNVFLEVWLGSGLLGLLGFVVFVAGLFFRPLFALRLRKEDRPFLLFITTATLGLAVFNFFNSGILLGFFFLYLALGTAFLDMKNSEQIKK